MYFSERLEALRERVRKQETKSKPAFTLTHYLYILTQANKEGYINYKEGAIALYYWLTKGNGLDLELSKYPRILDSNYSFDLLGGWTIYELAAIIATSDISQYSPARICIESKYSKAIVITQYEAVTKLVRN